MDKETEAKKQFKKEVKGCLNRWFEESDLDVEHLTGSYVKALQEWLDEEIIGFESEIDPE